MENEIDPTIRLCANCEKEYINIEDSIFCPECESEYEPGPTEAEMNDETTDW